MGESFLPGSPSIPVDKPFMEAAGIEPANDSYRLPPELGHHIAGFIDGEGCFHVRRMQPGRPAHACGFSLGLRDDDGSFLREIREACGDLGAIYRVKQNANAAHLKHPRNSNPGLMWTLQSRPDCLALVAILDRFPLRSKKRRDYDAWRLAVMAWCRRDYAAMEHFAAALREGRQYRETEFVAPEPDWHQLGLEVLA